MEKRSAPARRAGGAAPWILGTALLAIAVVAAAGVVAIITVAEPVARREVDESVAAAHGLHVRNVHDRQRGLELAALALEGGGALAGRLAADDRARLGEVLAEERSRLRLDLLAVLDAEGTLFATAGDEATAADLAAADLARVVAATGGEKPARGALRLPGALYDAYAAPLVADFEVTGYLLLGDRVDDALAGGIRRVTGTDAVYLAAAGTGPAVAVSTLDEATAAELVAALRARGDVLARALERGEVSATLHLGLAAGEWAALVAPLPGLTGAPAGAVVTLEPVDRRLEPLRRSLLALALGTAAAAFLATLLALVGRHRLGRPWRALADAAEAVRGGQLDRRVPALRGGAAGRLATALDELRGELRERRDLAAAVARAGRRTADGAATIAGAPRAGGPRAAKSETVVVVGFELRRFADPRGSYDPEARVAAFAADLEQLAAAVGRRDGRVVAVAGHRVTALFAAAADDDGAEPDAAGPAERALAAAAEALLALGEGQSAFEDAEAPAIAIAVGTAVTGALGGRPRWPAADVVTGLPVQQLESLLREATPGEIFLARGVHDLLAERFAAAGVAVRQQRPILGTQPLYALDAERARQATGVEPPSRSLLAGPGATPATRGLGEVAPGAVLGDRFVVLGELEPVVGGRRVEAEDRHLGEVVRLSLVEPGLGDERAAELRSRLRRLEEEPYPGLVRVLDYGRADGLVFVSEQMPPGTPLARLLERDGLPPVAALRVVRQVARALETAHGHGVVHGCLGPADVYVDAGGGVRVGGFVLPAVASETYCAPDRSRPPAAADLRDDVYSLGALARETLTGAGHGATDEAPGVDVPERFRTLIARCLASREERPATVGEVLAELAHLHA